MKALAEASQTAPAATAPTDWREHRGKEIARVQGGGIRQIGDRWTVPSQTDSGSGGYLVDLVEASCTCPDYELRREKCKHQHAVEWHVILESNPDGTVTETVVARRTYRQNWPAYNAAQTCEQAWVVSPPPGVKVGASPTAVGSSPKSGR